MSFNLRGTSWLRPSSLLADEPLLATATSGPFSADTEVCCRLWNESLSPVGSVEERIL